MTKQNPDELCESCKEFDYIMNRQDGVSCDMFVVCEHDEEVMPRKEMKEEKDAVDKSRGPVATA